MLISKFDLYKPEWLELVFDHRNKEYGAYDLRQHYAGNMVRAMGATFLGVGLLFGASVIFKSKPLPVTQAPPPPTVVVLHPHVDPPIIQPRTPEPVRPPVELRTTAHLPPIVTPDINVTSPPLINTQITGAVGPITTNGKDNGAIALPDNGTGTGVQPIPPDNVVHTLVGLDVMPAPVGGEAAWAKFLRKNLRFPSEAQDAQVSGRVILSFVIEKDGHLSNIVVERGAGYGFDEEAVRVLKLAKAWTPGQQNGQPVRVKYMIPINFQLSSDER